MKHIESGVTIKKVLEVLEQKDALKDEPIRQYQKAFIDALGNAIKGKYGIGEQKKPPQSGQVSIKELEEKSKERVGIVKNFVEKLLKKSDPDAHTIGYYLALPVLLPVTLVWLAVNINKIESEARADGNKGMSMDYREEVKPETEQDRKRQVYAEYHIEQQSFLELNSVGINSSNIDNFILQYLPYFENSSKAAQVFDLYIRCKNIKSDRGLYGFKRYYKDLCEQRELPTSTTLLGKEIRQRTNEAIIEAYETAGKIKLGDIYFRYYQYFSGTYKEIIFAGIKKRFSKILDELIAHSKEKKVLKKDKQDLAEMYSWVSKERLMPYIEKYQSFDPALEKYLQDILGIISAMQSAERHHTDEIERLLKERTEQFLKEEIKINKELIPQKPLKQEVEQNILPELVTKEEMPFEGRGAKAQEEFRLCKIIPKEPEKQKPKQKNLFDFSSDGENKDALNVQHEKQNKASSSTQSGMFFPKGGPKRGEGLQTPSETHQHDGSPMEDPNVESSQNVEPVTKPGLGNKE